jgi:hypothetical protein
MSGGPIIGTRQDEQGRLVYWVVALLRSCVMSELLISGFPPPVLGQILRSQADQFHAEGDMGAT